jgi:hypothetical protein
MDGNWLGISPTSYPEKYSTVKTDNNGNVVSFLGTSTEGYDNAFIGLASIWDYEIFWNELESTIMNEYNKIVQLGNYDGGNVYHQNNTASNIINEIKKYNASI